MSLPELHFLGQLRQAGADGGAGVMERVPVEPAAEGAGVGGRRAQAAGFLASLLGEHRPGVAMAGGADGQRGSTLGGLW
ncbi:hypothetical protein BHM03_00011689 [Ensete ventricosum]|nr:hypothetical protein BHM03_00011689 [Ensete ventricosum]